MSAANTDSLTALLAVYRPSGPCFVRGQGSYLIAEDGRRYLDFTSGLAVNALGYGSETIAEAIRAALDTGLIHASNLFVTRPAGELAAWLTEHSFADRAFFCNSGAEANEGAIKFARRWARAAGGEAKREIVAFRRGFHGRTMGALAATDRPDYQEPFRPLMPGVHFCEVGDIAGLESLLNPRRTAAVLIEPIQAEGGVLPVDPHFLKVLRYLCDESEALLIFDEVQVGMGRTGTLWAHQQSGVEPDLMTLAKPLAGGLPMGAVLLTGRVAEAIQPGDHATTFGGGPLVATAALAVCKHIGATGFLERVKARGQQIGDRLGALALTSPRVSGVRGAGLIWGVEIVDVPAAAVVDRARERGLLLCTAGPRVVRLLPPLNVGADDLEQGLSLLEEALQC
jgi:acetylornithine/N-succinyldiaminopimelate aminotransferase